MRSMARVGAYFLFSSVILTTLWHSGDTAMGGSLFTQSHADHVIAQKLIT